MHRRHQTQVFGAFMDFRKFIESLPGECEVEAITALDKHRIVVVYTRRESAIETMNKVMAERGDLAGDEAAAGD